MKRGEHPQSLANLKPVQPGEVRNPRGRAGSAGTTIKEWVNVLAQGDMTEAQIREVARDKTAPWTKRAAAERILRTLEVSDIADFAKLLNGEATLEELKAAGVNTEVIKRLKQRSRTIHPRGGDSETLVEREIELHDRAGVDFDRICDRTDGKPKQSHQIHPEPIFRTPEDRAIEAATVGERLERLLHPHKN